MLMIIFKDASGTAKLQKLLYHSEVIHFRGPGNLKIHCTKNGSPYGNYVKYLYLPVVLMEREWNLQELNFGNLDVLALTRSNEEFCLRS